MLIAICGREGAGKSTIAGYLSSGSQITDTGNTQYREPLSHIIDIMFNLKPDSCRSTITPRESLWGLSYHDAEILILGLLRNHIDTNFSEKNFRSYPDFPRQIGRVQEISFADPLKKIAAIIFGIDYEILLGNTPETRVLRETIKTKKYNIAGELTGRQCLEYLGTEVWRNQWKQDTWTKIFQRDAGILMKRGVRIIIPDLRFPNEKDVLDALGGKLLVVYKDPKELILTEEDQKTHPAKWKFLTILNNDEKKIIYIHNNGTLEELYQKVNKALN